MVLTLPNSLSPGAQLSELWRALRARDRAAGLDELRWRLHLRLLIVVAGLSAGFAVLGLWERRLDPTAGGALLSLGVWAWLRHHPEASRGVARAMVAFFVCLALDLLFVHPQSGPQRPLLAMSVMTVFGALLDGLAAGAVAALACTLSAVAVLLHQPGDPMAIVSAFAIPAAWCFFLNSLSFSWLYGGLIAQQQENGAALAAATAGVESLARTLSQDVTQATARLQAALGQGWQGLEQAAELRRILLQARAQLPSETPEPLDAASLLEDLRHRVHRFFLWVALVVSGLAALLTFAFGLPLWVLGVLLSLLCALLLRGRREEAGWRVRLAVFLLGVLAVMAADTATGRHLPPAASLVFLPSAAFYAGLLGAPWLAWSFSAVGLGLLAVSGYAPVQLPGQGETLASLAVLTVGMAGVGCSTLPLYHDALQDLQAQDARLRQSLGAYRRLVSTLFHDLANPLSVLQGLASLPANLRGPEDLPRAQRMVQRLRTVSDEARGAANRRASQHETSARALADSLRDLFAERMAERSLQWMLQMPSDLKLRQGGNLLETILAKLMSNAVRFAPSGSALRFSAGHEDGGRWLRLEDSGAGFPDEALRDLATGRAPRPAPGADGELGNGFSLLLAQVDALDLGGRLTLSNPADGGARAELWLPD
jgi:signal transduction histidine kinase